jgi:hypothetical protein
MKTKIIILALMIFCGHSIMAQKDTLNRNTGVKFWLNIGLTTSFDENINSLAGFNAGLNTCFNNRHYIFLRSYRSYQTPIGFHGFDMKEKSLNEISTYALMYGIGENYSTKFSIVYSAGLCYADCDWIAKQTGSDNFLLWEIPKYKIEHLTTVGVPLNISFLWKKEHYAFSIDLYANIQKHSEFGIVLNNHIGKIGAKKKK